MKRIEITVNGTAYPCTPTMGAMLRFKEQTGREITEIDPSSFSDLCTYLWCCVASAAKREGKQFDMSLMDFADCLTPDDMTEGRSHDAWDRTRTVAAICIQPHVKRRITPRQLLPLPWDGKPSKTQNNVPELTPEEKQKRFEKNYNKIRR